MARRYEFYVRVRYCSCHEDIKFIFELTRISVFIIQTKKHVVDVRLAALYTN